jgi:hypothetical protein
MQAGSYPARTDRLALSGLMGYHGTAADEAAPVRVRSGVKPSYQNYQLKVRAQGTPNMSVIVSGGTCYIDQRDTGGQGAYVCATDGDVTLTIDAAGGAGQYRKDCVVASVYDAETSGSANEWRLEVIKGAYAASAGAAVRPALPANSIPLADIAIAPSQTSVTSGTITDVRVYAVAAGGILPVTAALTPARPHPGQVMYRTDTDMFVYGKSDGTTATLNPKPTSWQAITLVGSWVPNGGGSDPAPMARITADGTLELSGMIRGTAVAAGANANVGTLPAALFPATWIRGVGGTSVAQNYVRIDVSPLGAISLTNGSQALATGNWVQLDGVRGRAV